MGMNDTDNKDKILPWPWKVYLEEDECSRDRSMVTMIEDADEDIVCEMYWRTDGRQLPTAMLMSAAPELRDELEKLVKRTCQLCAAETKAAITPQGKPCESGRPCPYGLDGAKTAIAKSYGQDTTITDCRQ